MDTKKKITLVVLRNKNIGDSVIAETCQHIIEKISDKYEVSCLNLFPDEKLYKKLRVRYTYTYPKWKQMMKFLKYRMFSTKGSPIYKFYESGLKDTNAVIFAGGGIIKHTREAFWNPIYTIVKYCEEHKIPVYFNAVGIEGYDSKNYFSNVIKDTLNSDTIKYITTRDDLKSLEYYVQDKSKIKLVGDPALWTKETYPQITDSVDISKNDIIGVGLIRGKIFTNYGVDFDEDKIRNSYVNLIKLLDKKGYRWQMFCNGLESDYEMGLSILDELGLENSEEHLAKRPETSIDLIKIIGRYKAQIAARLHANIIAAALGIPSIGYVWNDKLKMFGEQLGIENRFIDNKTFENSQYVVEELEKAISEGYDLSKINYLKNLTVSSLEDFINAEVLTAVEK